MFIKGLQYQYNIGIILEVKYTAGMRYTLFNRGSPAHKGGGHGGYFLPLCIVVKIYKNIFYEK